MKDERHQIKKAIALQETLRGKVDDGIIDATIATLREKLAELEISSEFPELQRKQATILFADIVGSTDIAQHIDPEDYQDIFVNALKRIAEPIFEHGGRVIRYMGDGFLAIFGIPHAHENDPERAIRAGLEALKISQKVAPELSKRWGIPSFNIRVGINTDMVAISGSSEAEYTLMGSAVHLAARLEAHAPPGGLLISHNSFRHVRGIFRIRELDPVRLKGFDEPIVIYQVLGSKPRAFRVQSRGVEGVETHMVGREAELSYLQEAYHMATVRSEGQIITITGEAGIGKSRLLYEFQNWLELQPLDLRFFQGRASQETQYVPYSLIRDVFTFRFQIQDSDSLELVHQKIEAGFGEFIGMDDIGTMRSHIIGQLLGFDFHGSPHLVGILNDPKQLHDRASTYLSEYYHALCLQEPGVIFLEDIHWSDDKSLELINNISQSISNQSMLIICIARPQLYDRRPHWGEGLDYHHRIELHALSKTDSRKLVSEILKKVEQVPVALQEMVISWAEGNPFFIEELIKMLIENNVIAKGPEYWFVRPEELAQMSVPATLTGVLQARLDSLPAKERSVLDLAAVIGRTFWDNAIQYLHLSSRSQKDVDMEQDIDEILSNLRERELIYRREDATFADTHEYIFKHALLHDVAYENITKRERRIHHKYAAEWLKMMAESAGRGEEFATQIADHYLDAGEKSAARKWLYLAGKRARALGAMEEARNYFTRTLELTPEEDIEGQWSVLLDRHEVLGILGDKEARFADDATLIDIATTTADDRKLAIAYYRQGSFLYSLGRFPESLRISQKAVETANKAKNLALETLALGIILTSQTKLGDVQAATETAERILINADQLEEDDHLVRTLLNVAILYENIDIQKAIQLLERSAAITDRSGNQFYKAHCLENIGYYYILAGQAERGISALKRALALNEAFGSKRLTAYNQLNLGLAYYRLGDYQTAIDILKTAAETIKEIDDSFAKAACLTYTGLVLERSGQKTKAKKSFQRGFDLYIKINVRGYAQDALAGLARIALEEKRFDQASDYCTNLWGYLSQNGPEGMEFPIYAYLTCANIFFQLNDIQNMKFALDRGYTVLNEQAEKFSDDEWRQTYIDAPLEHSELLRMWKTNSKNILEKG